MPVVGEHGPPLVGHSFSFLGDMLGFARRQRERFGPVSWVGGFATRMVVALGPDAIEEVLTNRDRAFSNREGWNYVIGPFFKRGVMLMDFDEHTSSPNIPLGSTGYARSRWHSTSRCSITTISTPSRRWTSS